MSPLHVRNWRCQWLGYFSGLSVWISEIFHFEHFWKCLFQIPNANILTWKACSPLQTFMCRTCRSSFARALSLSLNRLSASRSLNSSSCSRLCCLCKSANSPMVDPALASQFPASRQRGRHAPPAGAVVVSCGCCCRSSSKMESCLMTAAWKIDYRHLNLNIFKLTCSAIWFSSCETEMWYTFG